MKKLLGIGLAIAISLGALPLSGCSLLGAKANGLIFYGSQQQINTSIDKNKSDIKEKNIYKMKLVILEGKKVLVMDKKTGEELVKKELLKKVGNENDTKAIDKLPTVTAEQGVLFAKGEVKDTTIDGTKLKYEDNTFIGDGRTYADMFAIVDDAAYGNVKGKEKYVGVLKLNKDPKKEMGELSTVAEAVQMVKIK
ncbi:hypothetical protein KPL47_24235 [Clostridium estertheticum]|uniref:lipoprotein BA_5634 family protein n=1 Tax=Clostridium estertheticum TaxID=238834 RepID=UPI001C0BEDD5|nr:lipoprotein BA_5634 family protein [Clostridium estertheticum]MBU3179389.1 hypothetical protein [Clostridium estertheticum]